MIVDRADELVLQVRTAANAARGQVELANATAFVETITRSRERVAQFGLLSNLELLQAAGREEVIEVLRQLIDAADRVAKMSDEQILALTGGGDAEDIAPARSIERLANSAASVLSERQRELIEGWIDEAWDGDAAKMDLLADVDSTQASVSAIRDTLAKLRRSTDRGPLSSEDLLQLRAQVDAARSHGASLTETSVPEDVISLWRKASTEEGAELEALTDEARKWIDEHRVAARFRIKV